MKKTPAQITFTRRFVRETKAYRDWLVENVSPEKGREFILELDEFIREKIASYPTRYMEWPWRRTPNKSYRRAIFKRRYVLVFKTLGSSIQFVLIYHQKRDPAKIKI